MDKYNKTIGKFGEDEAVKYLKKHRYVILERNYNIRGGEIDIIAKKGGYVIFVEVKTRSNNDFGGGLYAVTYQKQKSIIKTAQNYILKLGDVPLRFDVISITGKIINGKFAVSEIEHIKNAF